MKKLILFSVYATLFFFFMHFLFIGYDILLNRNAVQIYPRFIVSEKNGENHFNWWAFISPIQSESQSIVKDTLSFSHKVFFPCGKNNAGEMSNIYIADQISNYIYQEIQSIDIKYRLDYDKTSEKVRMNQNPKLRKVQKPFLSDLSLYGTSSAEYVKYGFEKSIQKGSIEKENLILSRNRLDRIGNILENRGYKVSKKFVSEIQLSNSIIKKVIEDKSILDKYRFVEAKGLIITEKVKIKTIISPIFLPVLLGMFIIFFIFLIDLLKNKKEKIKRKDWWVNIWKMISIFFIKLFYLIIDFLSFIFFLLSLFLSSIFIFIILCLEDLSYWWRGKTNCYRVVVVLSIFLFCSLFLNIYLIFFK